MTDQPRALSMFVERLSLHSGLSSRERDRLKSLPVSSRTIRANEDFVRPGDLITNAFFVERGSTARFEEGPDGRRQIIAVHVPGEVPNLHSLVLDRATSGLQALGPANVLLVAFSDLRAAAADFPNIAEALWRDCMIEAGIMPRWIVNVGQRTSIARIAHFLCELAWRNEAIAGAKARFRLPMTQSQIAQVAGISSVHANRTLKALRSIGTTLRANVVTISDWNALASVGEFDDGYLRAGREPPVVNRLAA